MGKRVAEVLRDEAEKSGVDREMLVVEFRRLLLLEHLAEEEQKTVALIATRLGLSPDDLAKHKAAGAQVRKATLQATRLQEAEAAFAAAERKTELARQAMNAAGQQYCDLRGEKLQRFQDLQVAGLARARLEHLRRDVPMLFGEVSPL